VGLETAVGRLEDRWPDLVIDFAHIDLPTLRKVDMGKVDAWVAPRHGLGDRRCPCRRHYATTSGPSLIE